MKIIVVDDEIEALETFLGYVIDEYKLEYKLFMNSPLESVNYVEENQVDCAFLDICMPQVNGVELAEKLVNADRRIKIVFISAFVQDEDSINEKLKGNLYGFCYKPFSCDKLKKYLDIIKTEKNRLEIKTFGMFEVFLNGKVIKFSSAKSKELLALLTEKNGSLLTMNEAIAYLWGNKEQTLAKRLYRDAVCRLRMTLKDNNINKLVSFGRGTAIINKSFAECDLWNFYKTNKLNTFNLNYMPAYEWSIDTQSMLEVALEKQKKNIKN